jgi:hypothetical protein
MVMVLLPDYELAELDAAGKDDTLGLPKPVGLAVA